MACSNPEGELTASAKQLLQKLADPLTPVEASAQLGQPVFKVRSGLREMLSAGLVEETEGRYRITEEGKKRLEA